MTPGRELKHNAEVLLRPWHRNPLSVLLSPCLAQVELTPCKHQAQLTLNCTVCAISDWIHSNLTDLFHSGTTASKIKTPFNTPFIFINFIFFKLHKRTLFFQFFFPHLFYSNASCREIPSWDKAAFCSDLTRPFTNTILLRRFALTPTLTGFKLPSYPPLFRQHEINPLLHCSLSLLFKYLLLQLSLVSSTNSYRCWLIFSHQKSSTKFQFWGNFYIK